MILEGEKSGLTTPGILYVDNIFNNNFNNNNDNNNTCIELKSKEIQFGLISKVLQFQDTSNKLPEFLSAYDINVNINKNNHNFISNDKSLYMILFNNNNNNNAILNDTIKQEEKEMNKLLYDNKFIYNNLVAFYPLYVNNNFNATLNDIKFQLNKVLIKIVNIKLIFNFNLHNNNINFNLHFNDNNLINIKIQYNKFEMKRIIMKNNKLMFDSNLYFDNNNNSSKDIDNYNNDNESSSLCPMFIRRSSSLSLSASFRLQLHLDWYLNKISQFFQPAIYSSIHSPNNNNKIF
jgi:hypothetical protein